MRTEFKVQAISEKVDVLEVNGQVSYDCLHDCKKYVWFGNSSSRTQGCHQEYLFSPYINSGN